MDGPGDVQALAARVAKLRAAGRITVDDAEEVLRAAESGNADAKVAEIRLRHATEWVRDAVKRGRMTQAEADALLERLQRGDNPRLHRATRNEADTA